MAIFETSRTSGPFYTCKLGGLRWLFTLGTFPLAKSKNQEARLSSYLHGVHPLNDRDPLTTLFFNLAGIL